MTDCIVKNRHPLSLSVLISSLVHVAPSHVEWFASGCGINPKTNPVGSQTPATFLQL